MLPRRPLVLDKADRPVMHTQTDQLRGRHTRARAVTLAFVLAFLFVLPGFGLDPAKSLRQYVLRSWTSEQGLPQNSICAMLQTHDGLLWIGTRGGLARFDGASFVIFKSGAPNSIPGESITGLAEDRDGSLWISSNGGLTRYRDGQFHSYGARDGLPGTSIWRIARDPAGGVWAATRHSELFHVDGATVRRYASPIPARPEEVNALLEDPHGTLWIATFDGLFALDRERGFTRFTHESGLAGDRVYALALDRAGRLWTAGDGGLTHQTDGRFLSLPVRGLPTATLLAFDPSGDDNAIWTGSTGKGLFCLNARGVQRPEAAQGFNSDEVYLLYFSRDGSLWLGDIDGLNQLSDSAVTSYGASEGLPRSTLDFQRSLSSGNELCFGHGSTLFRVRDGTLVPMQPPTRTGDPRPGSSRRLRAIPLWVRSNDRGSHGLVLTDSLGHSVLSDGSLEERPLPPIPWRSVGTMLIAHDGTIWTGGSEIGVVSYPAHGPTHAYTVANGLDDNNVGALAEDAAGNLWAGTLSGLDRIHHGIVTRVVSCARVNSIETEADGSLWVGSDSGLIYVPHALSPVRVFTQKDGLPTSVIEGTAEDADGHLWLGTQQGIVRVNKTELLAPGGRPQSVPVVFGTGDGFRSAQLRTNSVFRSRHGDIWFLTLQELAMINPHMAQAKPLAPILIDQVDLDDQEGALAPVISLTVPAGRHRLRIRYTLPEFRIPGRIHFRYQLEGWDKNWIQASNLRDAIYTGIPPGRYTFRVAHSDGYGNWSTEESTLPITVKPYFYQTAWFLALLALLVITCISRLHRLRVAQVSASINARLQERLQERTRIARELHDTLLQGMLGVSMQMYAASQQDSAPSMLGHASQRLRDIAEQSRKALDDLRSPSIAPDSLETALAVALREMELPADVQPQIRSAGIQMSLRPLVQAEVERIVREAVANAVQHSGADLIRLDVVYQPAHFFVSVSDNGCGIDRQTQESGRNGHWGIPGMRERAESIGGRLRILPHAPHGTVVEISLPGAVAYTETARPHTSSIWGRRLRRLPIRVHSYLAGILRGARLLP